MKLYVPEIGNHLKLTDDWRFALHNEYRNRSLWEHFNCDTSEDVIRQQAEEDILREELRLLEDKMYPRSSNGWRVAPRAAQDPADEARRNELYDLCRDHKHTSVVIPAGSVLSVDRIFIRKGMDDWSSLTFFLKECPGVAFKKKPRFWAKLQDCNNIMFDLVSNT